MRAFLIVLTILLLAGVVSAEWKIIIPEQINNELFIKTITNCEDKLVCYVLDKDGRTYSTCVTAYDTIQEELERTKNLSKSIEQPPTNTTTITIDTPTKKEKPIRWTAHCRNESTDWIGQYGVLYHSENVDEACYERYHAAQCQEEKNRIKQLSDEEICDEGGYLHYVLGLLLNPYRHVDTCRVNKDILIDIISVRRQLLNKACPTKIVAGSTLKFKASDSISDFEKTKICPKKPELRFNKPFNITINACPNFFKHIDVYEYDKKIDYPPQENSTIKNRCQEEKERISKLSDEEICEEKGWFYGRFEHLNVSHIYLCGWSCASGTCVHSINETRTELIKEACPE